MAQKYKTIRTAGQHSSSFYGKSNPWNHWWAVRNQAGPLQPTTSISVSAMWSRKTTSPHLPTCWKRGIASDFLLWGEGSVTHCKATAISDNVRTRTNREQKITISQSRSEWSTCAHKQELRLSYMDRDSNSVFLKQSESLTHFKGLRQSFAG